MENIAMVHSCCRRAFGVGLPAVLLCALTSLLIGLACVGGKEEPASAIKLTPEEKKMADEMAAETEMGRNMSGRLLTYYGTNDDSALLGYVNQVGNYVASYGDYPERRYMFAILDTELRNAFACPGGYILITQGAIRAAHDEAELAAILSHESVHVGAQHMWGTLRKMKENDMEKNVKELASKVNVPPEVKMRERPTSGESSAGKLVARYLTSGAAGATFNFLKAATAGMNLLLEAGIDHNLELEADREGVKYAIRAGYDPAALKNYLQRLKASKDKQYKESMGKTHPTLAQRIKEIKGTLIAMKAKDIIGAKRENRFVKMRKRLPAK